MRKTEEKRERAIKALADDLRGIADGRGINYSAGDIGKYQFDPDTGERFWRDGRPAELHLYGSRAKLVFDLIQRAGELANAIDPAPSQPKAA